MERKEPVYKVCAERNSPEAFRHFFGPAYPRFGESMSASWRERIARRFSPLGRYSRRLATY